jgi:hypothetical protein
VIYFLTFKWLNAGVIRIELQSVYDPEVLARATVKKWRRCFHQRRTDLFDDPNPEGS